ncbi:PepSY-associated TM helix domain-containing protein [Porticoccaceae bacterium LTM1]|nr:PepSY-associated TM helix domain-containing protein [Porticoccaceae bacterium LTM1]
MTHKLPKRATNHFRQVLWRWHRRLGLAVALLVLLLAVTGILINHSDGLSLDQKPVPRWMLSLAYDIEAPAITSFSVGDHWASHAKGNGLYWDNSELTWSDSPLVGAIKSADFYLLATGKELLLVTSDGTLAERIDESYGLPQPVNKLGISTNNVYLKSGDEIYQVDVEQLAWTVVETEKVDWTLPVSLPEKLEGELAEQFIGKEISWERWLLDLHSGRLFGNAGPWLMDVVALSLIILAISGFSTWYSAHLTRRRRKQGRH